MMKLTVQVQTSIEMSKILSLHAIFNLDNKSYVQLKKSRTEQNRGIYGCSFFGLPFQFRGCSFSKESDDPFSGLRKMESS